MHSTSFMNLGTAFVFVSIFCLQELEWSAKKTKKTPKKQENQFLCQTEKQLI